MTDSQKTTPVVPHWPSTAEYAALMQRIAEHSHNLMHGFLARNKTPPMPPPTPDPAHLGQAFLELTSHLMSQPRHLMHAHMALWQDYARLWQSTLTRMAGSNIAEPVIAPVSGDKRFQDSAWQDLWLFDYIKQSYLLTARWMQGIVRDVDGLDGKTARKIDFYTRQMVDAIAPSNFWMTNPEVLRATIESSGENLVKGLEHLLGDLERGQGQLAISMTDNSAFRLGENIAGSKGKVVYQNKLIQLIQYAPLTPQVNRTPLLIFPPWINKYYILDMREKNSLVRYLVEQGHTVFCISWANPDETFADINFDDYMSMGLFDALRAIARVTGEDKVNVVGYCIGGTLLASALAYLKAADKKLTQGLPEIASATYFVALTDFTDPGDVGVFIDETQIAVLEAKMAQKGYLPARDMNTTFNLLRANDLIWSFVVNNYLLGKEPFPFDLLYWNSDSTNIPAAMHSFYLRNMYLENKMVQPHGIAMKGVPIDLRDITTPSFLISTQDDHIAPWRSTYAATQLYKGPLTFVLAGSGHIAGIVNHPSANKYGYYTNPKCPAHPDDWLKDAVYHTGSWWPAWMEWLKLYAGDKVPAREPGVGGMAIEDAPGSYVRVRAI
jgi:polyhydroxyalkanoate synthase subunit PhaC